MFYTYYREITIDHTKVGLDNIGVVDSTAFPVVVELSGVWLKTVANGGHVANSNGYDIIFTEEDGETLLYHEIQAYDGTAGTLIAWVAFPNLSKSTDTDFIIHYGNSSISSPTENSSAVWSDNFVAAWHLDEDSDGTVDEYKDSSPDGNDGQGVGFPIQVTGKIGEGQDFTGDDYIDVGDDTFNADAEGTLETWINHDAGGSIFGVASTTDVNTLLNFRVFGTGVNYKILIGSTYPDTGNFVIGQINLTPGQDYHIVITGNGTTWKLYVNGVEDTLTVNLGANVGYWFADIDDGSTLEYEIGAGPRSSGRVNYFDGILDEMRVSDVIRSDDWIVSEYNNQVDATIDSTNFITYISEEGLSSFTYYRDLIINHTLVGLNNSGTLDSAGFPVVIELSGDWLKSVSQDPTNGHVQNDNGYDIVFSDTTSGEYLYHEIQAYDGTAGTLIAWVRIDSLSKSTDTNITIHYGNADIKFPTENSDETWGNNFVGVYHLDEEDTGSTVYVDKSPLGNDGASTSEPTQVAGKIGNAQDFSATASEFIDVDNLSQYLTGEMSIGGWVIPESNSPAGYQGYFGIRKGDGTNAFYVLQLLGTTNLEFRFMNSTGSAYTITEVGAVSGGTPVYLALTYNSADTDLFAYVNGVQIGSHLSANGVMADATLAFSMGRDGDGTTNFMEGIVDEARVSDVVRSPDWIVTIYNNQTDTTIDPANFIKELGNEQSMVSNKFIGINQGAFWMAVPTASVKSIIGVPWQ